MGRGGGQSILIPSKFSSMRALIIIFVPTFLIKTITTLKSNTSFGKLYTTASNEYPYIAAILQKTAYLSSGALIDESWVLTGADSLYTIHESTRTLRVRLGSTKYNKGGYVLPVKFVTIHPYFDDSKPLFDVALIKLSQPVKLTDSLNPIRLQKKSRKIAASHFIVTSWSNQKVNHTMNDFYNIDRTLKVSRLLPTDEEQCSEELETLFGNKSTDLMCLDPGVDRDPCQRDIGAPVVLNGILWGILSSWTSEDCDIEPMFVTLISNSNISSWIHFAMHKKKL